MIKPPLDGIAILGDLWKMTRPLHAQCFAAHIHSWRMATARDISMANGKSASDITKAASTTSGFDSPTNSVLICQRTTHLWKRQASPFPLAKSQYTFYSISQTSLPKQKLACDHDQRGHSYPKRDGNGPAAANAGLFIRHCVRSFERVHDLGATLDQLRRLL
jgi:hypothetical protein